MGGVFYPLDHDMTIIYAADGTSNPPRGVLGGTAAKPCHSVRLGGNGERTELPAFAEEVIRAGTKIEFTACGGGGYGDPMERDPARVVRSVNRGWISHETARDIYRVALRETDEPGVFEMDDNATAELRK